MRFFNIIVITSVFIFLSGCNGANNVRLDESQTEISGSFSHLNIDGDSATQIAGTALYHVTPSTQIGPMLALQFVDTDGGDSTSTGLGGLLRHNLAVEGASIPFVQAGISLLNVSGDFGDGNGQQFNIGAGIRSPLTDSAFIVTSLDWNRLSGDGDSENFVTIGSGISVRF